MGLLMLKLRTVELESRAEQTSDCKLVYILGNAQDMVLDSYLRQIASSQVTPL